MGMLIHHYLYKFVHGKYNFDSTLKSKPVLFITVTSNLIKTTITLTLTPTVYGLWLLVVLWLPQVLEKSAALFFYLETMEAARYSEKLETT
jgi:hypothetical protein